MQFTRINRCPHCAHAVTYRYRMFRSGWDFACPGCARPLRFMTLATSIAIALLLALWFAWQHLAQPRILADLAGFAVFGAAAIAADYYLGRLRALSRR